MEKEAPIQVGDFTYQKDEKGNYQHEWKLRVFKQSGALKKPYKELPAFKCIIQGEKRFIDSYKESLANSVRAMFTVLNSFGK